MAIDNILKQIDIWSDRFLKLIFLIILIIGLYISYDMWYVYHNSGTDTIAGYKPEEITEENLKAISENVVGWIKIDNTSIDYPVLQGKDNVEYINKNPFGEYSLSGSIFLDSRNKPDFSDDYNIIYGHHMSGGYMFGALDYFKRKDYFKKHQTGTLFTGNKQYPLQIIGILITDANVLEVFDTDFKGQRLPVLKKEAKYWNEKGRGRLVALTTCKEPLTTARTVLLCLIKERK